MIPKHKPLPAEHTFPSPTSTESYWRANPHPLDSYQSTPTLPEYADIVIIGSGMSGVSTAYHILQESKPSSPPSIAILEARQLCSGATGRNGGHLKVAVPQYVNILERHGKAAAKEVADFHVRQLYAMKDVVEREGLDCDFLVTRSFDVFMQSSHAQEEKRNVSKLREADIETVAKEVQVLEGDLAEAATGVNDLGGARGVPAAQLWPYNFVAGLLSKIIDQVNFQTRTVVESVSGTANEQGLFGIKTSRGAMGARKVVFASNGYTAGIIPSLEGVIVPWKGTASSFIRRHQTNCPKRTFTYNIYKDEQHVDYLNHRVDGTTIIGGAREAFEEKQSLWLATVDDSTLIEEEKARDYFANRMETYYSDWADSGARVDKIWTGIMGYTEDGFPLIGALPDQENQFIIAGFNGAGMLNIFLSSKGLAQMIVHGDAFEKTGIPSIYKITNDRIRKEQDLVANL